MLKTKIFFFISLCVCLHLIRLFDDSFVWRIRWSLISFWAISILLYVSNSETWSKLNCYGSLDHCFVQSPRIFFFFNFFLSSFSLSLFSSTNCQKSHFKRSNWKRCLFLPWIEPQRSTYKWKNKNYLWLLESDAPQTHFFLLSFVMIMHCDTISEGGFSMACFSSSSNSKWNLVGRVPPSQI